MRIFRITNMSGITGPAWSQDYETIDEAREALRRAMGWKYIYLSTMFSDGDGEMSPAGWWEDTAVCAYESQEDRDRDDEGAYAPRITSWRRI